MNTRRKLARTARCLGLGMLVLLPTSCKSWPYGKDRHEHDEIEVEVVRMAEAEDATAAEKGEVREVRRRLAVMRYAVDVLAEEGRHDHAHLVELAMHSRELTIEGRRDEEAQRIREAAPDRAQLSECLAYAADLCEERGREEKAQALEELAGVYREQWERRLPREPGFAEGDGAELQDLEPRVEILRWAAAAFDEAGEKRLANRMNRFVHVGELQLQGADEGEILGAFDGLEMGTAIELLQGASRLYEERGWEGRAGACRELAEFYARRERGEGEGEQVEEERGEEKHGSTFDDRGNRIDVLRIARHAHAEAEHGDAVGLLERTLHVAELQAAEADPVRIGQAAEGLSMELIIELVDDAAELWGDWGHERRAHACAGLARYYRAQEEGRAQEEHGDEHEAAGTANHEIRHEILLRIERMRAELDQLEELLLTAHGH